MTHFQMYLILKANSLVWLLGLGGFFGLIGCLVVSIIAMEWGYFNEAYCTKLKRIAVAFVMLFCFAFFIPSTKDIAMIYVVPAIINNEDVRAIPPELAKLARTKIEEMLKEEVKE